jgi:hypothetical protein
MRDIKDKKIKEEGGIKGRTDRKIGSTAQKGLYIGPIYPQY